MAENEIFTEQWRVTDCDCDMNHLLVPGAYLRMAQQISTDHCLSLGMDDDFYRRSHAVFLMAKLAMEVRRPPKSGEVLTLRTMPELPQPRQVEYRRKFNLLYCEKNEPRSAVDVVRHFCLEVGITLEGGHKTHHSLTALASRLGRFRSNRGGDYP